MSLMGHVENGVVVFDTPTSLPDGTEVEVTVRKPVIEPAPLQTHFEIYKDIIGAAVGLPEDFAENHDHYIHGTPKR